MIQIPILNKIKIISKKNLKRFKISVNIFSNNHCLIEIKIIIFLKIYKNYNLIQNHNTFQKMPRN